MGSTNDQVGEGSRAAGDLVGSAAGGTNAVTKFMGEAMTTAIQFISNITWYEWLCIVFVIVILFIRAYVKGVMDKQTYSGGVSRRYKY